MSKEPFTIKQSRFTISANNVSNFHRRFSKNHKAKILCQSNNKNAGHDLGAYMRQKEATQAENSLNFESELFVPQKIQN